MDSFQLESRSMQRSVQHFLLRKHYDLTYHQSSYFPMLTHLSRLAIAALINSGLLAMSAPSLANTTQTVFYVSTSGSTGQVNYDIHLNPDCSPAGATPVYDYHKKADGSIRELNSLEQEGYRIVNQTLSGNSVTLIINAFEDHGIEKPITITSSRLGNGACQSQAFITIDGDRTQLSHAHVDVNRRTMWGQTVGLQILSISLVGLNQQTETIACDANCSYGL